jgi:hypothetical protein
MGLRRRARARLGSSVLAECVFAVLWIEYMNTGIRSGTNCSPDFYSCVPMIILASVTYY